MDDRFHKENREISIGEILPDSAYLLIDSKTLRKPGILSIQKLGNILQIQIDEDTFKRNVTAVTFSKQDEIESLPPESLPVDSATHISVDENYLYVWVPQSKRWKRLPLSIW
jgi:hypothetical protein